MLVKHAKAVARQWVVEEGSTAPGFLGAYHAGSTIWLPDDAVLPAASDVDIMLVLAQPSPLAMSGKLTYRGVLLDVAYLPSDAFRSPAQVLADYHLAGAFRTPNVILDPSGYLTTLQAAVAGDYAKRRWVSARCEHARNRVLWYLRSANASAPLHDRVIAWLFATGITTHVLLVAGLKNPTVRRRYTAARQLLAEYGHLGFYETLLELLGCARLDRARVEQHLAALAALFDSAKAVLRSPFPFAHDICDSARPIAIDGSRDLIERGYHREAIFWIAVTYSRCQKILYHDAPVELADRFGPGYRRLLADLAITSDADLQQRCAQVEGLLPRLWEVAEDIMVANRAIED
jgi:hypothetical protein